MAAIDAYQRDFRVTLAADCIGSYDDEHARVTIGYLRGKMAEVAMNAEILATLPSG
jgi:isochorismate hydrolase